MGAAIKISLEEFLSNPDIHYYDFHELHNGDAVVVSPPSDEHIDLQKHLESLFGSILTRAGYDVFREYYYTLASNSRRADVAASGRRADV